MIKTNRKSKKYTYHKSDFFKKSIDINKTVSFRIKLLASFICIAMFLLSVKLYNLQILNQEKYNNRLTNYTQRLLSVTPPRGEMIDSQGNVIIGNSQQINISYFPVKNVKSSAEYDLAYNFSKEFDFEYKSTSRDKKDLYLSIYESSFKTWVEDYEISQYNYFYSFENLELYESLITDEEMQQYKNNEMDDMDLYYLKLSRINDVHFGLIDESLAKMYSVKQSMDFASSSVASNILTDVSNEQMAYLIEHSTDFNGFSVVVDWQRENMYDDLLRGVFGSVSNESVGIPINEADYLLAKGYELNDKIGISGLEKEYEVLLNGEKTQYSITYDADGMPNFSEMEQGVKGYDLQLTLSADFQIGVQEILNKYLAVADNNSRRLYMDRISVVAMDPVSGDIYALATQVKSDSGEIYSDPVSTYTMAYEAGSIVKGAVVYMGQTEGVIDIGEVIVDQPMKVKSTPEKSSWKNLGAVNDIQALAQSSNVYMMMTAARLGGGKYSYNQPLYLDPNTFDLMRNYFSLFGLGVKTGIDVPNEFVGYVGNSLNTGNILDFAIGQYDTYTVMQLAQYASVIANDGIKVVPRLVSHAYEASSDEVVFENQVTQLSVADNYESIQRIQMGLLECSYGSYGLCKGVQSPVAQIAAKTGTAEAYKVIEDEFGNTRRVSSPNNSTISYAPYDNPEIAIGCLIPNAWNGVSQSNLCLDISQEITELYYEMLR